MSGVWTAAGLLVALMLQAGLGRLWPDAAGAFDPFLLVVLYAGLLRGETQAMLTGVAAGWMQDVLFGGPVAGFSALAKLLVGFGVGLAAANYQLASAAQHLALVVLATLLDVLLFEALASLLGAPVNEISLQRLALRAAVNAAVGVPLFQVLDRRLGRGGPASEVPK